MLNGRFSLQRIFVYGTLRRGERFHGCLRGARWLGEHRTEARYSLLNLGAYPAAVTGGSTAIVGEVYAINHAILIRLDRLEGHPWEFIRKLIPTPYGQAWIYLYHQPYRSAPQIPQGDWRCR